MTFWGWQREAAEEIEATAMRMADADGDTCLFHPERNVLKGHGPGECAGCDSARERYREKARLALAPRTVTISASIGYASPAASTAIARAASSTPTVSVRKAAEEIVGAARRPEWGKDAHRDIEHAAAIIAKHFPTQPADQREVLIATMRDAFRAQRVKIKHADGIWLHEIVEGSLEAVANALTHAAPPTEKAELTEEERETVKWLRDISDGGSSMAARAYAIISRLTEKS